MLLSSNNHIHVGLGASYIAIANTKENFINEWAFCELEPSKNLAWSEGLDYLKNWLASRNLMKSKIQLNLSSELCPVMLLGWDENNMKNQDQRLIAKANFINIYGPIAENWKVIVKSTGFNKKWLACGIDSDLIGELNDLNLISLQSVSISLLNVLPPQFKEENYWLLIPEYKNIVAYYFVKKSLLLTKTFPRNQIENQDLVKKLKSEIALSGLKNEVFEIYSTEKLCDKCITLDLDWGSNSNSPNRPIHFLGSRT